MTIYYLPEEHIFPDPTLTEEEGLLAIGGDLHPSRILAAYNMGIFPWFSDDQPPLWWSPNPRLIMLPQEIHVSKTLKRRLKRQDFEFKIDHNFEQVIAACAQTPREDQDGTWITSEMQEAYITLHKQGYAHSFEVYYEGELAGGLYGISIGSAFFGESMFSHQTDASKLAFVGLCRLMQAWDYPLVDCQVPTDHLKSLGAIEISRDEFLAKLKLTNLKESKVGSWEDATRDLQWL